MSDRTPIGRDLSRAFVEAANDVRLLATEDQTSPITTGITTSTLLEWARTAAAYRQGSRPTPIKHAAETAVIEPHYGDHAGEEVLPVLLDSLQSAVTEPAPA